MSNKWKYFFSYALPWASMLSIEKNGIAFITFILQLSVIGWLPAAIWAHSEMKKHIEGVEKDKGQEQEQEQAPAPKPDAKSDDRIDNSQEIIKASKSSASKTTTKKTKTTSKKTTSTTKPKAKPKSSS